MITCLLLLLTQDLYWYEHYEEAEKSYRKGDYALCLSHIDASLKERPTAKKAEIIRAVQKIEYKPYYYKALALFKLGHLDEAVAASSQASQGEVVRQSFELQNDLFPILREYSRRIQTYRQEINKEQMLINRRRDALALLATEDFDGANQILAEVDESERDRFTDIQYILNMINATNRQAQTTQNQSIERIESYLSDDQPQSAKALFLALHDVLTPDIADPLEARIDAAIDALPAVEDASIEETDPAEKARLELQLEQGLSEIKDLQQQRELMRESLDTLESQNERLQAEIVTRIREGDTVPGLPNAVLIITRKGLREADLEIQLVVPAGVTSWSVTSLSADIQLVDEPLVSTEADTYTYEHSFPKLPYGLHYVSLTVTDQLGRKAQADRLLDLPRPFFAQPRFWILSGCLSCLLAIWIWIRRRRTRRLAMMRNFNPYIAGAPVLNDDMFYGRDSLVDRIVGLVHKNSLMIYGERRIGKTSLLYQIKNRLSEMESDTYVFLPAYIDLQGIREDDLFHHVMADFLLGYPQFAESLQLEFREENERYRSRQFSKDIKRIIEAVQANEERHLVIVLLMDEVDVINEFSEKTNQKLRGIFMKEFAEHLSCVMAGIHLKKEWESSGSPWYNFFEEIPMTFFDEEAARELILEPVRGIFKYDNDAVSLILNTTTGQPYLIQKICVSLINGKLSEQRFRIKKQDVLQTLEKMKDEMKLIQGVN